MNIRHRLIYLTSGLFVWFAMGIPSALAEEYTLAIQPIQSQEKTRESYQPLANYLSKATGATIKIETAINFVAYWQSMRKDKYDLLLDAAHFTDWRIKKKKFTPLAKVTSVVSFTLVSHQDEPVLELSELIGKPVAVLSSPSMGAVRLAELFPNPMRQPVIVEVNNSEEAVRKIQERKAFAAIIPSPMVGGFPFLSTIQSTAQVPHMALSASPAVPREIQDKIRKALVDAKNTPEGQEMLKALFLEGFEPATPRTYDGYAKLLKGVYGY